MLGHSFITTRKYGGPLLAKHLKYLLFMKQYCYPLSHNVIIFKLTLQVCREQTGDKI